MRWVGFRTGDGMSVRARLPLCMVCRCARGFRILGAAGIPPPTLTSNTTSGMYVVEPTTHDIALTSVRVPGSALRLWRHDSIRPAFACLCLILLAFAWLFFFVDLQDAIVKYTECLDSLPDRRSELAIKCFSNRSACYKQLSNFDATVEDTTAVLEVEPENVKALVRRAQAFEAIER